MGGMEVISANLNRCKQCGKSFSRKFHLEQHENIHTKTEMYKCDKCEKRFNAKSNLRRHIKTHDVIKVKCHICQKAFNHEGNLNRHMKTHENIVCKFCEKKFTRKTNLNHHLKVKACIRKKEYEAKKLKILECVNEESVKNEKRKNEAGEVKHRRKKSKTALGVISVAEIFPSSESGFDLNVFLSEISPKVKSILCEEIKNKRAVKWYLNVSVVMGQAISHESDIVNKGEDIITINFRSEVCTEQTNNFLENTINDAKEKIINSFKEFTQRGSGWTILNIIKSEVIVAKYQPLAT